MRQLHVDLQEVEKAYLAGLIDGEGCLNVYKTTNRSCKRQYTFVGRLTITNCNLEVLVWVREILGMGRIVTKPVSENSKRKQAYDLCFYAREVRLILPHIMPYLRIKKQQAVLVYDLLSRQKWGGQKSGLTDEEYKYRQSINEELHRLNRRGVLEITQ